MITDRERRKAVRVGQGLHDRLTASFQYIRQKETAARIDPGVALALQLAEQESTDGSD